MRKKSQTFSRVGKRLDLQTAFELDVLRQGPLTEVQRVALEALSKSLTKKWEETNPEAERKALAAFQAANAKCKDFRVTPTSWFDDLVIGECQSILYDWFSDEYDGALPGFGPYEISRGLLPGPGASLGAVGDDFYLKLFCSDLTATDPQLISLYRSYISSNPLWSGAEDARRLVRGERIVSGSSLSFVPKNVDISRTICTEPSVNMLFQKALGSIFERILARRVDIHISKKREGESNSVAESPLEHVKFGDRYRMVALNRRKYLTQPDLNKELCRIGSLDDSSEGYCTIDLKSASDSISLGLCKLLLPPFVMRWLERTRSQTVTLPSGESEELFMVSSMGNGFTFPLQTMIFASIVRSVYKLTGTPIRRGGAKNFGVFGDDIIVTKRNYDLVVRALTLFGFTVNTEKSYSEGWFRESCGADYYKGTDVRGVYVKGLRTEANIYSSINRLNRWQVRHELFLPNTLDYLLSLLKRKLFIPFREDDSSGLKVKEEFLPARKPYELKLAGSRKYIALVPAGRSYEVPVDETSGGQAVPQDFVYIPDGILLALVGGYLRNGRVSQRLLANRARFNLRVRSCPYWDYDPQCGWLPQTGSWKASWRVLSHSLTW
jgi:hypothetical protein